MNELFYLHLSYMTSVALALICGFTLGYVYKYLKDDNLKEGEE